MLISRVSSIFCLIKIYKLKISVPSWWILCILLFLYCSPFQQHMNDIFFNTLALFCSCFDAGMIKSSFYSLIQVHVPALLILCSKLPPLMMDLFWNRKTKQIGRPMKRSKNVRKMKAIAKAISASEKTVEKVLKNENKKSRVQSAKTLYEWIAGWLIYHHRSLKFDTLYCKHWIYTPFII